MDGLISELTFLLQRLDWAAALDIILVTAIVFTLLRLARGTQAVVLLRANIRDNAAMTDRLGDRFPHYFNEAPA